jgi:predicted RNase H-like HicB family nuclease
MHVRAGALAHPLTMRAVSESPYFLHVGDSLTLTAVFTPDENGWTMAQLAEWPAVVTCAPTLDEARAPLEDAAREIIDSYRTEGCEPLVGGGRVEQLTINVAA